MKIKYFSRIAIVFVVLLLGITALMYFLKFDISSANPGGKMDYIQVWCSSCSLPGLPQEGHLILFDTRNGDIWVYSDNAMVGKTKPVYYGKLSELGQPVVKK